KEVGLLSEMLQEKQIHIELTDAARDWLAEHGYDPQMGARPMARLIEQKLKKPLSQAMVFGTLAEGGTAKVDVEDGDLEVRFENAPRPVVEA
ncbi:MAG: ATP-dependent Clp protease ATP-binding subunit ClpA, partial [Myxococcota bacterium]